MTSIITRNNIQLSASKAAAMLQSKDSGFKIPEWQRADNCWTVKRQQLLIDSILKNFATPEILVRIDELGQRWLEDGLQRITAIAKFISGDYACGKDCEYEGKSYVELPPEARGRFNDYLILVQTYKGSTEAQAVEQFIRRQDGVALTTGEKLHALVGASPVVKLAKNLLLTAGSGFHDRAKAVWGARCGADKRRRALENAVALVAGACMGNADAYVTVNWGKLTHPLSGGHSVLTYDMDEEKARYVLDKIITVYERANDKMKVTGKKFLNQQWLRGNFSGYMVHTFTATPREDHEHYLSRWVDFVVHHREGLCNAEGLPILTTLKAHVRWENGHKFLFSDDAPTTLNPFEDEDDDDELDEDSE